MKLENMSVRPPVTGRRKLSQLHYTGRSVGNIQHKNDKIRHPLSPFFTESVIYQDMKTSSTFNNGCKFQKPLSD